MRRNALSHKSNGEVGKEHQHHDFLEGPASELLLQASSQEIIYDLY